MALNFPSNPTLNQVYTGPLGQKWKWNGEAWVSFNEIVSVPTASYLNGFELDLDVPPADGDLLIYNTDTSAWENSKTLTGNYTVSGSLTIRENLTVLGSASITYISESTLNIGTNLITVNTINPGARFGGLAVIDSGSSPLVSASFLYDSVQDEFIFVHKGTAGGAVTSSHFILGPETYNDLGNEIYLTANRIPKGTGIEHLNDSNISDDGSVIKTISGSNDIGLKLDFLNNQFTLGNENQINGYGFIRILNNIYFENNQIELNCSSYGAGDLFSNGNETVFIVDDLIQIIKTSNQGNDIGLKLNFSSSKYELGQLTGGNQTKLTINDATQTISITGSVAVTGLSAGTGSSHVIMYNTASGQFFFTGSSAIGGGNASNDNFQQIFLLMGG
jgi:hypothetical protein